MFRVNSNAVVVALSASTDELPAAFLLLEIETGRVWKEEKGEDHAAETEPRNYMELLTGGDVAVHDSCCQSTELTASGRESVGCSTDGSWIDFGSNQESNGIGAELVEERRQEVHGLERLDVSGLGIVGEMESGDDEEDKVHEETDHLHLLASIELVVNEEGCKRMSVIEAWCCGKKLNKYLQAR